MLATEKFCNVLQTSNVAFLYSRHCMTFFFPLNHALQKTLQYTRMAHTDGDRKGSGCRLLLIGLNFRDIAFIEHFMGACLNAEVLELSGTPAHAHISEDISEPRTSLPSEHHRDLPRRQEIITHNFSLDTHHHYSTNFTNVNSIEHNSLQ